MESIEQIRKRIQKKEEKNPTLKILSFSLIIISIVLSFLIYMKKDQEGKLLSKVFGVNVSFYTFNANMSKLFNSLFVYSSIEDDVKEVSSPVIYIPMKNNYFTAEGNDVKALFRGKVLSSEENNGYYSLIVYYGDDLYGLYFNLVSLSCKIYDKVDKGDTLGYFEESFKALFKKGNELIDYEEIYSK